MNINRSNSPQVPKMKPNIFIIADDMKSGGMERQIIEQLKGFHNSEEYNLVLGVLDRGGEFEQQASDYASAFLPLQRSFRFDVRSLFGLIRYAKSAPASLIHAYGWMSGIIGLLTARLLHIPLINGSIRNAYPELNSRLRFSRWCMLHSNYVIANSYAGLQAYDLADYPKAKVIYNGIDLARFDNITSIRSNYPTICMVANFSPKKDHLALIRAMPTILQAVPDVKLILVGRDDGFLTAVREASALLGLDSRIEYILNTNQPAPYIAGSDVCVLFSTMGEGLSNSILEYMALSKPVIATTCPGNMEVVLEGETGFLVPNNDPLQITKRTVELLSAPEHAAVMGRWGRERVVTHFNIDRMIASYANLYDQLLRS